MSFADHNHPIWRIIERTLVTVGIAGIVMYMNASNFDKTEWTSLVELATIYAGLEFTRRKERAPSE